MGTNQWYDRCNYATGYLACMYLGYLAGGSVVNASSIQNGLAKILTDIRGGKSLDTIITELTGNNMAQFENNFASMAKGFVRELTQVVGNGTGGVIGGLTTSDDILPNTNQNIALFQLNTSNDTASNTYPAGYDVYVGEGAGNAGNAGNAINAFAGKSE